MKIKLIVAATIIMSSVLVLSSCGISKEKYDTAVSERDTAKTQLETANSELATTKTSLESTRAKFQSANSQIDQLKAELSTTNATLMDTRTDLANDNKRLSALEKAGQVAEPYLGLLDIYFIFPQQLTNAQVTAIELEINSITDNDIRIVIENKWQAFLKDNGDGNYPAYIQSVWQGLVKATQTGPSQP